MKSVLKNLFLSLCLLVSTTASAITIQYGDLLAGSFQPDVPFASLDLTGGTTVYNFTITAYDLNAIFTPGAFIGALAVDLNHDDATVVISNVSGGAPVTFSNGGGPTGVFDFRFDLTGPKGARLTANESVSWTATFSRPVAFNALAMHVQGLTEAQGGSAWYVNTSPIPEPETYGMLLFGIGMIGFVARRKRLL